MCVFLPETSSRNSPVRARAWGRHKVLKYKLSFVGGTRNIYELETYRAISERPSFPSPFRSNILSYRERGLTRSSAGLQVYMHMYVTFTSFTSHRDKKKTLPHACAHTLKTPHTQKTSHMHKKHTHTNVFVTFS